jgi:hypothetical protein
MNDPAQKRQPEEGTKLGFETFKQLTTLNAGSIVVIGTFLSDIFPHKNGVIEVGACIKFLITLSLASFGISLVTAILTMGVYASALTGGQDYLDTQKLLVKILVPYLPLGSFVAGLLSFGLAVVVNLYS